MCNVHKTLSYYNSILKGFYTHYTCKYYNYICKYSICKRNKKLKTQLIYIFQTWGTPVFSSGLANMKRKIGVGSIPLKSIVFFKQAQRAVGLSRTGSRSRSESAGTNSIVRSFLYLLIGSPIDDPIYGREMGKVREDK